VSDARPLDPEFLFRTLAAHRVAFILIGALGARLYGFPRVTADADITPAPGPENLERLATALRALDARIYTESVPEGLPFDCSPAMLGRSDLWNLVTRAGRVDVAFRPAGTAGFDDLAQDAVRFDVFGISLDVASLEDIIRSKSAANRPKDRTDVPLLKALQMKQPQSPER
jgi:hypothetical protein